MPPALTLLFLIMDFCLLLVLSVLINYSDSTEIGCDFEEKCADGWHYYPKSDDTIQCFKVFTEKRVTFREAKRLCSQRMRCFNSQLASFHSSEEYDFIVKLQKEEIPLPSNRNSWIGMMHSGKPRPDVPDKKAKNRFKLRFVDGTPMFNFSNMDDAKYGHYWGYNGLGSSTHGWEPNGDEGRYPNIERCVEIGEYRLDQTHSDHGIMNDNYCEDVKLTFICKYKIEPKTTTSTTTTTTTTTTPTTTTSTSTTTTPTTTTTTTPTTTTTTTEPTTTTASTTTTMPTTSTPTTQNPTTTTAAAAYYTAPHYQFWPPPQPAGYNVPSYAIAPPFPPAQPQPNPEHMVLPMNYAYYNGYIFPSRNGPNDFYNKALLAAFDSSDLDPIDFFESQL